VAWLIPRAHGTPTMKGMEADDLLCSRNARPEKALVGRAQWKINQPPSLGEITSKLGGIIEPERCSRKVWSQKNRRGTARPSFLLAERAR
jgi:hypothetical protein